MYPPAALPHAAANEVQIHHFEQHPACSGGRSRLRSGMENFDAPSLRITTLPCFW